MTTRPRVLFRVAAGPRVGFGHLMRCRALARAIGIEPRVSIRGSDRTRAIARALGLELCAFHAGAADVVVVDDPSRPHARASLARARRAGTASVSISDGADLGRGSSLTVVGSVDARPRHAKALAGAPYVVLDPSVLRARLARRRRRPLASQPRVLIALGGGAHVFRFVPSLIEAIVRRCPGIAIDVAAGLSHRPGRRDIGPARWIERPHGLARDLARCDAAIVGGGVTLLEACAIGVPAVGFAVVPAQRRAIRALAARGAVIDAGADGRSGVTASARAAAALAALLRDGGAVSTTAYSLIDGRGALRVAARILALPRRGRD